MKNILISIGYILFSLLLTPKISLAGGEISGGGTLLVCKAKSESNFQVTLYDLKNNPNAMLKLSKFQKVETKISQLKIEPLNLENLVGFDYLKKLKNPIIDHILKYTSSRSQWFSMNIDLAMLYDVSNPKGIKKDCFHQLAVHYSGDVIFQKDLLQLLEQKPLQQAAAILHEALRIYSNTSFYDPDLFLSYHSPETGGFTSEAIEKMVSLLIESQPLPAILDEAFKLAMNFPFYSEAEVIQLSGINTYSDKEVRGRNGIMYLNKWLDSQKDLAQDKSKIDQLKDLVSSHAKIKHKLFLLDYSYNPKDKVRSSLAYYEKLKKDEIQKLIVEVFDDLNLEYDCQDKKESMPMLDKLICIIDTKGRENLRMAISDLFYINHAKTSKFILTYNISDMDIDGAGKSRSDSQKQFIDGMTKAMKFINFKIVEYHF